MIARLNRGLARALFLFAMLIACGTAANAGPRADASVSAQFFYDELEPYGRWVDHRVYGLVWVPAFGDPSWHPYTYGRWVWTADYGWYWDSDEDFGWATYHYGRWAFTADYGWVWVPGDVWGPAWVDWRYGDGHVGWAPMPPEWTWRDDTVVYARVDLGAPAHESSWVFVSESDFARGKVRSRRVPTSSNRAMLRASVRVTDYADVNGRIMNRGVDVARLSAATKVRIEPARVTVSQSLGGHAKTRAAGSISIYRPRVVAKSNADLSLPPDYAREPWENDSRATARERVEVDHPAGASVDPSMETTVGGTSRGSFDRTPGRGDGIGVGGDIGIGAGGGLRIGR